ncbi:Hypothetical predicted protein [Pelobates cultripes]|uniref:Uncharacterized protein n=1 Tax=Pelobates cultripes TaxID=61616 RepID=A0AAD1WK51_PELCU|nr:Hypothetical predicted protein [Pelobates cultripes]
MLSRALGITDLLVPVVSARPAVGGGRGLATSRKPGPRVPPAPGFLHGRGKAKTTSKATRQN